MGHKAIHHFFFPFAAEPNNHAASAPSFQTYLSEQKKPGLAGTATRADPGMERRNAEIEQIKFV